MAKGKTVPYTWMCQDCNKINGHGNTRKENVKELERKKYCPCTRKVEVHKAKLVKKGGTRALK